jgi:hypothetical protein
MKAALLVGLLALGSPAWSQNPPPPAGAAAPSGAVVLLNQALTLHGRLVDGTAMARSLKPEEIQGQGQVGLLLKNAPRIPLAERPFRIHLLGSGRAVEGRTDSDGRFAVPLGLSSRPEGAVLVAEAPGSPPAFSPAVALGDEEIEFRLYSTTDSEQFLECRIEVDHSLAPNPSAGRLDLEVRVEVTLQNFAGELYVGHPRARWTGEVGSPSRAICRIPLPPDASLTLSRGPAGESWNRLPAEGGWSWMVVDSPVFPLFESPRGNIWEIRYRIPAAQEIDTVYPVDLELFVFAAWGREEELTLQSPDLLKNPKPLLHAFRPGERHQDSTVLFQQNLKPETEIPLAVHIDNAKLGQVNHGTLLLLALFLLVVALAIGGGLYLGRRRPSLEAAALSEASGEDLIQRIAQLDQRREKGEVQEKEYREARGRLISMARYLVPELGAAGGAAAGGGKAAAKAGAGHLPAGAIDGLPEAARDLLDRLKALDAEGSLDSRKIHERALLLEELARVLGAGRERRGRKGEVSRSE